MVLEVFKDLKLEFMISFYLASCESPLFFNTLLGKFAG